MSKKILPVVAAIACLGSLPAMAEVNTIIGYDGLGEGGYALINPGMHATEASGIITLVPGTGASDSGSVAPPNCTFSPAQQFETTAAWPFPSQFIQYGKDPTTGNVTVEWRTGAPLVTGQQYLISRVCAPKATNPPA